MKISELKGQKCPSCGLIYGEEAHYGVIKTEKEPLVMENGDLGIGVFWNIQCGWPWEGNTVGCGYVSRVMQSFHAE